MPEQPGYTMVPNAILDNIARFSEAELCLLLVVIRQTVGWQKECDMISLTQFEKLTGLSRPSVNATLQRLKEMGYIEQTGKGKRGIGCYRIGPGLVNSVNQLTQATSKHSSPDLVNSVNQTSPGLVNSVNTQKKDLKEKKERGRDTRPPASLDFMHEGVTTWRRLTGKRSISPTNAAFIANKITDIPLWERAVAGWVQAGHNPENVKGIGDWYDHPDRINRAHSNGRAPADERPSLPVYQTPKDRPPAEESRKRLAERAKDIKL